MNVNIEKSWKKALADEFTQPYFKDLVSYIRQEYADNNVFPPGPLIFNAFDRAPLNKVKVVIIGQDPYHGPKQAHGLSFSVNDDIRQPPSLKNIFKEIETDLDKSQPSSGNLERWADQGVLLLNATLTVRAGLPGSHQKQGWERFTDAAIKKISEERVHVVFMLWGAFAQQKAMLIDSSKHLILKAAHPSPFAAHRGFFGCRHFSKANKYLQDHGLGEIDW